MSSAIENIAWALCSRDPRYPLYSDLWEYDDEKPVPREEGCACDSCFYGKDKFATALIDTLEVLGTITDRLDEHLHPDGKLDCDDCRDAVRKARAVIKEIEEK